MHERPAQHGTASERCAGSCAETTKSRLERQDGSPRAETLEWPVKAMERIEDSCRKRGHATGWHAPNEFQDRMEVEATKDWAGKINRRGWKIDIHTIRKNSETYPDCIAEMDGERIGVEVTELVDGNAIREHPENPRYEGPEQFLREFSQPMPPKWPFGKFRAVLTGKGCVARTSE